MKNIAAEKTTNRLFRCTVTMVEIYMDRVFDLFRPKKDQDSKGLPVMLDEVQGAYVRGARRRTKRRKMIIIINNNDASSMRECNRMHNRMHMPYT